jgi:dTDP-4-amino-4,6-dideoxygalactose transaminase
VADSLISLSYNPIDIEALAQTLKKYEGVHHAQIITDFETEIRQLTGARYVVALNSGTSAIHLALRAVGVGQGDEVLVSTFTFIATVNPIIYLGATPIFIDSEAETWNMDPVLLEQGLETSKKRGKMPKAILAVHTYGMPAQMVSILEIARRYEVPVIEDAAEAIGASFGAKHLGTLGDVGALSFNHNKLATCYGGGAILTNNKLFFDKVTLWAAQAGVSYAPYTYEELGYNYKMSPLNAAAGLVSVAKLPQNLLKRRVIFDFYKLQLAQFSSVSYQMELEEMSSNYWLSCFCVGDKASAIMKQLRDQNIETRPVWKPMHLQPAFAKGLSFVNGTSEKLFNSGICLPSGHHLIQISVEKITNSLKILLS